MRCVKISTALAVGMLLAACARNPHTGHPQISQGIADTLAPVLGPVFVGWHALSGDHVATVRSVGPDGDAITTSVYETSPGNYRAETYD